MNSINALDSFKYQLLKSDFAFACQQLKEYQLIIEEVRKENESLRTVIKDWERISDKQVEHLTNKLTDEHFETLVYLSTLNDVESIHKAIKEII